MNQKKFNRLMTGFIESEEGEKALGLLMLEAIRQSMLREMKWEDGTSTPGEKVLRKEKVHILERLAFYMPRIEAAIRGCQSDAGQARNMAGQARDSTESLIEMIDRWTESLQPVLPYHGSLDAVPFGGTADPARLNGAAVQISENTTTKGEDA